MKTRFIGSVRLKNTLVEILLKREIDWPFLKFLIKSSLIVLTGTSLFIFPQFSMLLLIVHLSIYIIFFGPFITMYHDINHVPIFKHSFLNEYIVDFIGLFYGLPPKLYFSFHVIMHHPQNNGRHDISTTMPYQRDSIIDFIKYSIRFFFSHARLFDYLKASRSKKANLLADRILLSEVLFISTSIALLIFVNVLATVFVLLVPVFMTRMLLIIGNWGEHALIDPDDPGNNYRNSVNIIGFYNKGHFNVGFHIGHHNQPALHFTLLENEFYDNINNYAKEDAIIFRDLHYPHIWFYLMSKNYKRLAKKFVQLPNRTIRSNDEIIELLKHRLIPIRME